MTNNNTHTSPASPSSRPVSPGRATRAARRPFALLGGSLAAVAVLAISAAALAQKAGVTFKVDDKPVSRTAPSSTESYAPIVKQVAPSVIKVLVTERASNAPASGFPFFNDPRFRDFFGPFFG